LEIKYIYEVPSHFIEQNELPALFNEVTQKWSFQSTNISNDYTSK